MGTFRGKPRRNGHACGRQYLRSAICATRSKGPRGPAVEYGPHRTIYLTGKVARAHPLRPYGSAHFGPGWPWIPTAPIDTREVPFPVHPHMLRHGCGFALANAGHDTRSLQAWLGHKNIQHTVRYTELAPDRFRNFWRD
jgi:integrase